MFMLFGTKLKGLGRLRLGFKVTWLSIIFIGLFYLMYYIFVAVAWMMYGCCLLVYYFFKYYIKFMIWLYKLCYRKIKQVIKYVKIKINLKRGETKWK